jgi:hypothetical protein
VIGLMIGVHSDITVIAEHFLYDKCEYQQNECLKFGLITTESLN